MLMYFLSYMEFSLFVFFTCCNVCVGSCLVLVYTMFKILSTYIYWINIWNATSEVGGAVRPLQGSLGVKVLRLKSELETYNFIYFVCFPVALRPQRGPGPPHSRGFQITHSDASHSAGLLWTGDQLVAETSTGQHITLTTDKHPCPPVGFEPTISAGELPQTYALDRAATGIGAFRYYLQKHVVSPKASMPSTSPGF